jgi:hypothetical protein
LPVRMFALLYCCVIVFSSVGSLYSSACAFRCFKLITYNSALIPSRCSMRLPYLTIFPYNAVPCFVFVFFAYCFHSYSTPHTNFSHTIPRHHHYYASTSLHTPEPRMGTPGSVFRLPDRVPCSIRPTMPMPMPMPMPPGEYNAGMLVL